jgi:LacI family transcriptional regulator
MRDVAREAGTSVATVSRVLNNKDSVDPELVRRVVAAASKLGYTPNPLARNLRLQRTNLWLLIISDIENTFFTSVARGVEDVARQHGFSVVLCNADEDEKKEAQYVDLAANQLAAGVILSPHSSHVRVDRLTAKSIPLVAIDRSLDAPVDFVTADSRGGAQAATQYLLDQGWRRPACITGPKSAETAVLRRLGYEDALAAAGLRTPRVVHKPFHVEGGRVAAAQLLDRQAPPDSFFVGNAALALGVLEELHARGLRQTSDVGLICFDEAPWAEVIDPPIPVVSQPAYEIGACAAELLVKRINGALRGPVQRVVFDTELVVRGRGIQTPTPRRRLDHAARLADDQSNGSF